MTQRTAATSRFSRFRNVIGWIVLAVSVVIAVSTALASTVGDLHVTRVLSNSMQPTFTAGDFVIVQDRPVSEIGQGDVVVLPNPNDATLFIHRITSVERPDGATIVTTKGDNNPDADAWSLNVTSPTVPVYVTAIPTHSWNIPVFPALTSQLLMAAALLIIAITLLLPPAGRPAEAALTESHA